MNERDWAKRLDWDITRFDQESGKSTDEQVPAWYCEIVELARELRAFDLSRECRRREAASWRYEPHIAAHREAQAQAMKSHAFAFWRRHPVWAAASGFACLLLAVVMNFPGVNAAAGKIVKYVQQLFLGEHLMAVQISDEYQKEIHKRLEGKRPPRWNLSYGAVVYKWMDGWSIKSMGGNGSFGVPAGADPSVKRYHTLQDVQIALPYPLQVPEYLPADHGLREALVTPDHQAYLFYGPPKHEIIVTVTHPESRDKCYISTDSPIEKVKVNGTDAAWMDEHPGGGLSWERDGYVFFVQSVELDKLETMRVAESIHEVPSGH